MARSHNSIDASIVKLFDRESRPPLVSLSSAAGTLTVLRPRIQHNAMRDRLQNNCKDSCGRTLYHNGNNTEVERWFGGFRAPQCKPLWPCQKIVQAEGLDQGWRAPVPLRSGPVSHFYHLVFLRENENAAAGC